MKAFISVIILLSTSMAFAASKKEFELEKAAPVAHTLRNAAHSGNKKIKFQNLSGGTQYSTIARITCYAHNFQDSDECTLSKSLSQISRALT